MDASELRTAHLASEDASSDDALRARIQALDIAGGRLSPPGRLRDLVTPFFELSNDLLCIAGQDGYFKRINTSFLRALGYYDAELLNRPYLDFVHPLDRERTVKVAASLEDGCIVSGFENRYRHRNGSYVWLTWVGVSDPDDKVIYAVARDVTHERDRPVLLPYSDAPSPTEPGRDKIGSYEWDLRANRITWTSPVNEMLGIDPGISEGPPERLLGCVHPDDRPVVRAACDAVRRTGTAAPLRFRIVRPDGTDGVVRAEGAVVLDAYRRPIRIVGTVLDEGSYARDAAPWSFRPGVEASGPPIAEIGSVGLCVLDAGLRVVWVNEKLACINGSPVRSYVGRTLRDVMPRLADHVEPMCRRVFQTGKATPSFEVKSVASSEPGGVRTWVVQFHPHPLPFRNGALGLLATFVETTELARTHTALRESEERLQRALHAAGMGSWEQMSLDLRTTHKELLNSLARLVGIINGTSDLIAALDVDYTFIAFNASYESAFGHLFDRPLEVGLPLKEALSDRDGIGERMHEWWTRALSGEAFTVTESFGEASLDPVTYEITYNAIRDDRGRIVGASQVARDVTERIRVDQIRREFISVVNHELRTPLTSITGSLALIMSGVSGVMPEDAKRMIDVAHRNSQRLVRLINDMLDLQKMEAGEMKFRFERQDLMHLVRLAIEANTSYGKQYAVRFELIEAPESLMVRADADRILQVLTNLLSNAAKFSPEGDVVDVAVCGIDERARVDVRDHGPGIPEDFRSQVFGRFMQADTSTQRAREGSGLGLSICKTIIEGHGGEIGFETEVNEGTTFFFELPLWHEAGEPEDPETQHPPTGRVLVCEDDADDAQELCEILQDLGFTDIDVARTGLEADRFLDEHRYDLITLDMRLPDRLGTELLQAWSRDDRFHRLPVLIVSGLLSGIANKIDETEMPILGYVSKPIDPGRFKQILAGEAANGTAQRRPRVLYVEDDPDMGYLMEHMMRDLADVDQAVCLEDARALLHEHTYDLLILEPGLPDGNGLTLLPFIERECSAALPVLILSAREVDPDISEQVMATFTKTLVGSDALRQRIQFLLNKKGLALRNRTARSTDAEK